MTSHRQIGQGIGVPTMAPLMFAAVLAIPRVAVAAVIVVGDGTAASCTEAALQNALDTAQIGGGGTIRFECGDAPVTIALDTTEGVALTIPHGTTIHGGGLVTLYGGSRTIRIDLDARVMLKNLGVENGRVENLGGLTIESSVFSEGISAEVVSYGTLKVNNSTFRDQGGERWPISNYGTATVDRSAFLNSYGVIGNAGTLTVKNSIFSGNYADTAGGIYNQGALMIDNSEFSDNGGYDGGAITTSGGSLTIKNSRFFRNYTLIGPGAGAIASYSGTRSTIENCQFFDNLGYFGGAIGGGIGGGRLTVANSTFSGNLGAYGGAIFIDTGDALTITKSTITANTAQYDGGGILVYQGGIPPTLIRTTVTDNTPNDVVVQP